MPPKKQNGFMMFVTEWNRAHNLPIPQAVNQCGNIWKNMSEQEKGPFKGSAKDANCFVRVAREPLDCHGRAISEVERSNREQVDTQMVMKRAIENMVSRAKKQHDLENAEFMLVAFNYFIKATGSDVYIPAEFAACQFSLKAGKISIYSSHINPGQLIFGQGSDTLHHTSTTHQLPLPPKALGEHNMGRLYDNIVEYLRQCQGEGKPLVVFTTAAQMPVVTGCFRYLQSDSDILDVDIEIYDIQYLFFVLKKEVMDFADLPTDNINKSITDNFFLKDFFEYSAGIACQFHEDNDRGRYCTQSMVSRWCYTFCDYMCGDLAIKPLAGQHKPPLQEPRFRVTNANKSIGGDTTFASCQSKVKQEPDSSDYVPTDHSVFSGNLTANEEFPSLGGRKKKPARNATPMTSDWNLPAANRSVDDLGDAFNMSRR